MSWIYTRQTKKYIIVIFKEAYPSFWLGLCWTSNADRLLKRKNCSKPPSHITCMHFHAYFLFLLTWGACLSVWDSHTDINLHLSNTWILYFFGNFPSWTVEPTLLMASLFFPLRLPCSYPLRIGYDVYQVSCWHHLNIFNGLGSTWSSGCKVDHTKYRSQKYVFPSIYVWSLLFPPMGTYHKKLLLLDTWREVWGNFWWFDL